MRAQEMFSALTLNIALALFSMLMAIVALSLLAFVLAKESQAEKSPIPSYISREKVKRHESTTVDFRNPSTFPDHFLQLNTLMFQKKTVVKNNQITPMTPISLPGMDKMSGQEDDDDRMANRSLPPLPSEIATNAVVGRHRRQETLPEEDFSDTASTRSTEAPSENSTADWIVERSTIEPMAVKRTVDLECGSEVSLC